MGDYYYFKNPDPEDPWKDFPVPVEEVFRALRKIARNRGVKITDQMILRELGYVKKPPVRKKAAIKRYLYIDGTNLFAGQYEAVIMTGDADLVYAVEVTKNQGIPVHAVFFPNRFSLGIAYAASSSVVLNYRKRFSPQKILMPKSTKIVPIKDPTCKQMG